MPKRARDGDGDDVVQRSFAARPHLPRMDHLTPLGSGLTGMLVRIIHIRSIAWISLLGSRTHVSATAQCIDASEQVSCRMKKEISGLHEALTLLEHAAAAATTTTIRPETAAPLDLPSTYCQGRVQ